MVGGGVVGVAGGCVGDAVFDVEETDTIAVGAKEGCGILAGLDEPVEVDLEFDEGGVGVADELVEAGAVLLGEEDTSVEEEGELQAMIAGGGATLVEACGDGAVFVEGGWGAGDSCDDILDAELFGEVELRVEVFG